MASNDSPDKTSYVYNSQLDAFTLYHISQETDDHSAIGTALPALGHATSGALGTAISKLITYPLDVVITRLQVQRQLQKDGTSPHYNGFLDAIEKIYEREGGPQAFYSGVLQETFKGVADSFLFFLAYSYVRQKRLDARDSGRSLPALEEIGVGVIAGAFSKFFTTPIQQIVTRKQTAAMLKQESSSTTIPPLSSTRDIAWEIRREKGIQGFWSGYSASLILTLNPSITMLLHKALIRLVVPRAQRDHPGARLTFLLAAISKALASTVTYPFSLAKTRAQVSSQKPSSTTGETSEMGKARGSQSSTVQARQRTVFSTILRIAQTEGLAGLYQGLGAEVLKGFFSHGITMLMKDRIHTVIISLYYTLQRALQKAPSPGEIAQSASDGVNNAYEHGKEQASEAYAKGVEVVGNATESVRGTVAGGSQQAQSLVEKGKEQASDAYAKGVEVVSHATETAKGAVADGSQQAQDLVAKGREQASDVYSKGAQAAETASTNAQSVVHSASEQAQNLAGKGKEQVSNVYSQGAEVAETVSTNAQGAAQTASDRAGELYESGKDSANQAASTATQHAGDAVEKGKAVAGDVAQQTKDAVIDTDVRDINGPEGGIKK